jgi:hypothetical protein
VTDIKTGKARFPVMAISWFSNSELAMPVITYFVNHKTPDEIYIEYPKVTIPMNIGSRSAESPSMSKRRWGGQE